MKKWYLVIKFSYGCQLPNAHLSRTDGADLYYIGTDCYGNLLYTLNPTADVCPCSIFKGQVTDLRKKLLKYFKANPQAWFQAAMLSRPYDLDMNFTPINYELFIVKR